MKVLFPEFMSKQSNKSGKSSESRKSVKSDNEGFIEYFITFLKGLLMGLADVIPGVSGGTIAFITNIYDRFVHGLSNIGSFLSDLIQRVLGKNKKTFKVMWKKIDYRFFIPLLLGTTIAFLIGSKFIPNLIKMYPAFVFSLFVGLILASAYVVYKDIKIHDLSGFIALFFGIFIGVLIAIIPVSGDGAAPSYLFMFIVGAISVIAMIMPGISGSYIILMFGQYSFVLSIFHDFKSFLVKWPYFVIFTVGGIAGILSFSRLLSHLLKKYNSQTLFALTGLMLGAIYRPINDAIVNMSSGSDIIVSVIIFVIGIILVLYLNSFKK